MGNWRTVNIIGKVNNSEVSKLKDALEFGDDYENFHCLSNTGGLCGIGNWAQENISVVGNLAERGYSINDVAEQLEKLVKIVPSLELEVHCGGDYESKECIATITVNNKKVKIKKPKIKKLMEIPESQLQYNLLKALKQ